MLVAYSLAIFLRLPVAPFFRNRIATSYFLEKVVCSVSNNKTYLSIPLLYILRRCKKIITRSINGYDVYLLAGFTSTVHLSTKKRKFNIMSCYLVNIFSNIVFKREYNDKQEWNDNNTITIFSNIFCAVFFCLNVFQF